MSKLATIYIVRHGETEFNRDRKLQGQCDSPLTQNGIEQAKLIRKELESIYFDAVFSSDLLRAQKTAEIINLEKKLAITTSHYLRERSYGPLEGKSYEDFGKEYQKLWKEYENLSYKERFKIKIAPDVESEEEAVSRYITFLREIAVSHLGKKVLVVSHGGIMKSLLFHIDYETYHTIPPGGVQNCGHIILESDGTDFFVKKTKGVILSR